MTREELTAKIVSTRIAKGLSWRELSAAIGDSSHIVYTAALLGQMTLTPDEAAKAAAALDLTADEAKLLTVPP